MTHREPERCKECGHIVENRVLRLNQTLVTALYRVWKWCGEKGVHEFDRKEVRHLFTTETMVATFGDLQYFGGILYRPDGKGRGYWGINMERAAKFFSDAYAVNSRIVLDRITNAVIDRQEPLFMRQVPRLTKFLDSEFRYVPEYQPEVIKI